MTHGICFVTRFRPLKREQLLTEPSGHAERASGAGPN